MYQNLNSALALAADYCHVPQAFTATDVMLLKNTASSKTMDS
jgi:hypothetical protein